MGWIGGDRPIRPFFIMNKIDLAGKVFGRLSVLSEIIERTNRGIIKWACLCSCGNKIDVEGNRLRSGHTTSCGCYSKDSHTKHGECTRTIKSPEYTTYHGMVQRCTNPDSNGYENYGGRGVLISPRWLGEGGFKNFLEDMGRRPSKQHTLERKDNENGHYEKDNCI